MSVPKYIKEETGLEKKLKKILIFIAVISCIIWIIHVAIDTPSNEIVILFFPELYIFLGALFGYSYFHIKTYKEKIYYAENDIFETIAYRKKTSIKNLAKIKKIKERYVIQILNRLIEQEKLFGVIRDGLYISEITNIPICSLCNKDIDDRLLMVLCPYCKRPFHKDHIIDYINEMEEKCPNCKNALGIGDIIK